MLLLLRMNRRSINRRDAGIFFFLSLRHFYKMETFFHFQRKTSPTQLSLGTFRCRKAYLMVTPRPRWKCNAWNFETQQKAGKNINFMSQSIWRDNPKQPPSKSEKEIWNKCWDYLLKPLPMVCCQQPFFHPWTPGYVISQESLPVGTGAAAAMFCFLGWAEQEEGWGCQAAGLSGGTQHCLWRPGMWLLASLHRPSTISRLTGTHTTWHSTRSQCKITL